MGEIPWVFESFHVEKRVGWGLPCNLQIFSLLDFERREHFNV